MKNKKLLNWVIISLSIGFVACEMTPSTRNPGANTNSEDSPEPTDDKKSNHTDEDNTEDNDENLPILEKLARQTMFSSENTGAAKWLYPGMYANEVRISRAAIASLMDASGDNAFPVITIYQCLHCGGVDFDAYFAWIEELSIMISEKPGEVVLVIEPDTFAMSASNDEMNDILDKTCGIIGDNAENAAIFLDIGHSGWMNAQEVWDIVSDYDNLHKIDGWASNTANFQPSDVEQRFADELFAFSGKPLIIDTSRNGCGVPSTIHNPDPNEWCPGDDFDLHPDTPSIFFNYHNKPWDEED